MIDEKNLQSAIRRWGDREVAAASAYARDDLAKIQRRLAYRRLACGFGGSGPRTERPHPIWNGLVAAAMALVLVIPACRIHTGRPPTALETAIDSTIAELPTTDELKSYVEVVAAAAAAHLRERSNR